jgi:hypothetical protein
LSLNSSVSATTKCPLPRITKCLSACLTL